MPNKVEHSSITANRMTDAAMVEEAITTINTSNSSALAFNIAGGVNGEESEGLYVIFNPRSEAVSMDLPEGQWTIYINGEDAGTTPLGTAEGTVSVDPISAMVLVKENTVQQPAQENIDVNPVITRIIIGFVLGAVAITVIVILKKKRK